VTQPLILVEGQPSVRVRLSHEEFDAIGALGLAAAAFTDESGWYDVAAGRKIGAVSIGERELIVRPKVDINRLIFMVGYARNPSIWRDDHVHLAHDEDLLPALAEVFSRLASRALEHGLLQGYKAVSESLPVVRGRIRAGEQMKRRYGLAIPLEVEFDDFTVDIPENQLVLLTAQRLLRLAGIGDDARRRLQRLRIALADVSAPSRGAWLPSWRPTRLNARYQPALHIADVVLSSHSFDHHEGKVKVTGYMFDMWQIYEDFITVALGEGLKAFGGRALGQAKYYLDVDDEVRMRPDLVWVTNSAKVAAVVDAKYKVERPQGFPDADLYQMLAYCTALGLDEGHLIYAKGEDVVKSHTVKDVGVQLNCHTVDLSLEPVELIRSIDDLAALIASTANGDLGLVV